MVTFRLGARLKPALDVAFEAERPNVRLLLGVSDANCRTVDTLCGGRGSGVPGRDGFLLVVMKPYLSTSLPLISSQSSIPPANS